MTRPYEFNFSGVPSRPHKVTIDLDKVAFFNECLSDTDFKYNRTNVYLIGEVEPRVVLDMNYESFKKIMENK